MKILGIDTSTKFLSIGILDEAKIYEYNIELGRKHSSLLAVSLKRILDSLGWKAADIDYFACGLGPGSFTGTRIGLAAIKGLGFAAGKPVIGVSSLDIIARNAKSCLDKNYSYVVAAVDARRNLVYAGIYKNKSGNLKLALPYMLVSFDALSKKIRPNSVILGDAILLYKDKILKGVSAGRILEQDYWYPAGRSIIAIALEKIKNRKASDAFKIKPLYLYPKECQIKK